MGVTMHFHLHGSNIPSAFLDTISAVTDHAKLRYADIDYDESAGTINLPMTRFPLLKQRKVLGHLHDAANPISSTVRINKVVSFQVNDRTSDEVGDEVTLLFGLQISNNTVVMFSAEEEKGNACFSLVAEVTDYDIEVIDQPG